MEPVHTALTKPSEDTGNVQQILAEFDEEGVSFYQAYREEIGAYAVEHQAFGGPYWKPELMTWIKPSFAWVLYRSGYGNKHGQTVVLKIKLSHDAVARLLSECQCKHGGGGAVGRVQWDPARDLEACSDKRHEPRKMLRRRAIQIGLKGRLSGQYVASVLRVEDVTELARRVGRAHAAQLAARRSTKRGKGAAAAAAESAESMADLEASLPVERAYLPRLPPDELRRLGLARGETSDSIARMGRGQAHEVEPEAQDSAANV